MALRLSFTRLTALPSKHLLPLLTTTTARSLHMTGPSSFTTLLTSDAPTPSSLAADLARQTRLADALEASQYHQQPMRHFNTSRANKAVGDTSTIDFAYLPAKDLLAGEEESAAGERSARVPLLPAGLYESVASYAPEVAAEQDAEVMRPQIITASADSTHVSAPRAFGEVHDNSAVDVSVVAGLVAEGGAALGADGAEGSSSSLWSIFARRDGGEGGEAAEPGMTRTILRGMVEDLFGGGARDGSATAPGSKGTL